MPLFLASALMSCMQSSVPLGTSLNQELAGRIAGPPKSCIPTYSNASITAIDASTLVYRSGTTVYVNHPSAPCPAIAPLNTLIIDGQPGMSCRGDRVRGLEPGASIAGPVCILGDWVAYRKP